MRDRRKIGAARDILGIRLSTHFPEIGPNADRSLAWRAATNLASFRRAVRGDYPDVRSCEIVAVWKNRM